MKKWEGYQNGMNLGGWLSQCVHTKEHYDTFIEKSDLEKIASWGMDHVRLPIDYNLIQNEEGQLLKDGFCYLDKCVEWCGEFHLNLILDLHKTAGYSFDEGENEKGLFHDPRLIERFLAIWREMAARYGKYQQRVAFELLNEVVEEKDNAPWMQIAQQAIDEIRKTAPKTKILVGSYYNNSVMTVPYIAPFADSDVIYNFHCYEPLLFTHQGAPWVKGMPIDFRMPYPVDKKTFLQAAGGRTEFSEVAWAMQEEKLSPAFFEALFAKAIQIAEERDVMLYCGEYGVIDRADPNAAKAWYQDIQQVLERHGIGHAKWSYKEMDFGIADARMDSVREAILSKGKMDS